MIVIKVSVCYGLACVPLPTPSKDMLNSQSLVPQDVTLFEHGVISDVMS